MSNPNLSTLVYHSQAIEPFSEVELLYLLAAARSRNRSEGLTGLLVYDEGQFFQWIEGPPLSLQRVWHSIQKDPRHQSLRVITDAEIPIRLFSQWHMQFAHRGGAAALHIDGLVEASPDVLEALHQNPDRAPEILAEFSSLGAGPFARSAV